MLETMLTQQGRLIEVTTPLGDDAVLLNSFTGNEGISQPFLFTLDLLVHIEGLSQDEIADRHRSVKSLLGKTVSFSIAHLGNDDDARDFNGVVSHLSAVGRSKRFLSYRAEVVPWLWLLTLKSQSRVFQDKSVVDIIKVVFEDLKKSFPEVSYVDETSTAHTVLDYCVQYRESDFNFVSRLMEQEGIFYFFEHTDEHHTLVIADSNSAMKACPGNNQIGYLDGGIGEGEGKINQWEEQVEMRSGKYTYRDYHFQLVGSDLEVSDQIHNTSASPLEFYDYPGDFALRFKNPGERLDQVTEEGRKLVSIRLDEEVLPGQTFMGQSTCRNLIAGYQFALTKHIWANGEYSVKSVSHSVTQTPSYFSEHGSAQRASYQNHFVCVPAAVRIRPQRSTPKPMITGVQTAVVAVKSGEESWLDKYGRVRVQFHWQRNPDGSTPKPDESSTCWVRVAQQWAGGSWGAHFWPRVGQEVVVEFLEGDPDRPIITGSVYNSKNMPPYPLPANYTRSGIITRSSKQGESKNFNELRFEDKMGQEQIFLNAERDMDHRVEHDLRQFVGNNHHVSVSASQFESIGGDASRHVTGNHNEKITKKMSLEVLGERHEKIGQIYTVQAGKEIHLDSGQQLVIHAGQQISIHVGGSILNITSSGITIDGKPVHINCGDGKAVPGTPAAPTAPGGPEIADDGSKGGKLS
jgi:type VI secretion system secreted protein VgrG